jgi:hypothetical protein
VRVRNMYHRRHRDRELPKMVDPAGGCVGDRSGEGASLLLRPLVGAMLHGSVVRGVPSLQGPGHGKQQEKS